MENYENLSWDESEYNFFMSLTDEYKLEYMFDHFNTDYIINFESDDFLNDDFQNVYDLGLKEGDIDFSVIITETHLIVSHNKPKAIENSTSLMDMIVRDFIMDGMILTLQSCNATDTERIYKLIGRCDAYSVN